MRLHSNMGIRSEMGMRSSSGIGTRLHSSVGMRLASSMGNECYLVGLWPTCVSSADLRLGQ